MSDGFVVVRFTTLECNGTGIVGDFEEETLAKEAIERDRGTLQKLWGAHLVAPESGEALMPVQNLLSMLGIAGVKYGVKQVPRRSSNLIVPESPGIFKV